MFRKPYAFRMISLILLFVASIRALLIPSTYGAGCADNNILTYTIRSLLNSQVPSYGSLHQMWDFLYVKDVANALRLIGEKDHPNKTYGIGSGVYHPMRHYIETIRDMIDPDLILDIGGRPDNGVISSCVNIDELVEDTGFQPQYTFEEGISQTIEWWRRVFD